MTYRFNSIAVSARPFVHYSKRKHWSLFIFRSIDTVLWREPLFLWNFSGRKGMLFFSISTARKVEPVIILTRSGEIAASQKWINPSFERDFILFFFFFSIRVHEKSRTAENSLLVEPRESTKLIEITVHRYRNPCIRRSLINTRKVVTTWRSASYRINIEFRNSTMLINASTPFYDVQLFSTLSFPLRFAAERVSRTRKTVQLRGKKLPSERKQVRTQFS